MYKYIIILVIVIVLIVLYKKYILTENFSTLYNPNFYPEGIDGYPYYPRFTPDGQEYIFPYKYVDYLPYYQPPNRIPQPIDEFKKSDFDDEFLERRDFF